MHQHTPHYLCDLDEAHSFEGSAYPEPTLASQRHPTPVHTPQKTPNPATTDSPTLTQLLAQGIVWHGSPYAGDSPGEPPHAHHATGHQRIGGSNQSGTKMEALTLGIPEIDHSLPHGGLARGAIHELFYRDPALRPLPLLPRILPALLVTQCFKDTVGFENTRGGRYTAPSQEKGARPLAVWIGRRCWPTPFSLPPQTLSNSLFLDPPTQKLTLWAIETALRSTAVRLVVAECPRISLTTTRRFSHAAEHTGTTALLLRDPRDQELPSCCATRWSLAPTPAAALSATASTATTALTEAATLFEHTPLWRLSLERCKGVAISHASWIVGFNEGYEEREGVSLRIFSAMVDRCNETEPPHAQLATYRVGT